MKATIHTICFAVSAAILLSGCQIGKVGRYDQSQLDSMMSVGVHKCECNDNVIPFRYLVEGNDGQSKLPVVVFLHGAGQRGQDNLSHLYEGDVGHLAWYVRNKQPAILVAPQCPSSKEWIHDDMIESLDEFVAMVVRVFPADKSRVYLTGFSMGGIGTWKLALHNPTQYSTIVPVCGGPLASVPYEEPCVPEEMKSLNIWAFNNVNDGIVQNIYAKNVLGSIWCGSEATFAHLTETLDRRHEDEYVYEDEDLLEWIFATRSNER